MSIANIFSTAAQQFPLEAIAASAATVVVVGIVMILIMVRTLHVVPPNQVLVISGCTRRRADGTVAGYRTVRGGRALRIPFLETASTLDLTTIMVEVALSKVFGKDGSAVPITLVAAVRINPEEPHLTNAVERFLGVPREKISAVAEQVLEGVVREVTVGVAPDQIMYDRSGFAEKVVAAAELDFSKLGLELEVLKVQSTGAEVLTYRGRQGR